MVLISLRKGGSIGRGDFFFTLGSLSCFDINKVPGKTNCFFPVIAAGVSTLTTVLLDGTRVGCNFSD